MMKFEVRIYDDKDIILFQVRGDAASLAEYHFDYPYIGKVGVCALTGDDVLLTGIVYEPATVVIGKDGTTKIPRRTALRNIHLIEAAKDLLEVCHRARQLTIDMHGWTHSEIMRQFGGFHRDLVVAIARAEREKP